MRLRPLLAVTAVLVATLVPLSSTTTTAGAARVAATSRAIWPLSGTVSGFATAQSAARSFAVSRLGMDPTLTLTSRMGALTGVVTVRPTARALPTNIHVARLSPAKGWWVLSCTTPWIDVTSPRALAALTSPLRLSGKGRAFEAVLNVRLFVDGRTSALVSTTVMAGGSQLASFRAALHFSITPARAGTLIVYERSARDGSTTYATARRLSIG